MLPQRLPMLAVSAEPFDSADYSFEVKWNGIRALAVVPGTNGSRAIVGRSNWHSRPTAGCWSRVGTFDLLYYQELTHAEAQLVTIRIARLA